MTYPGAPSIYYGDEIGLAGGPRPGQPRGVPLARRGLWDRDLLHYFQRCIALRHARPALRRGTYRPLLAQGDVDVFLRQLGDESVVVALNAGDGRRSGSTCRWWGSWPKGRPWRRRGRTGRPGSRAGPLRGPGAGPAVGPGASRRPAAVDERPSDPAGLAAARGVNASLWEYAHTPRLAGRGGRLLRGSPAVRGRRPSWWRPVRRARAAGRPGLRRGPAGDRLRSAGVPGRGRGPVAAMLRPSPAKAAVRGLGVRCVEANLCRLAASRTGRSTTRCRCSARWG